MTEKILEYKYIKQILLAYIGIALMGAFLLMLPFSHTEPIRFIDALFSAVSALSVTGLIVTSTSENFTFYGEFIILMLIQIGGIGYMTLVTIFFLFLNSSITLDERKVMQASFDLPNVHVKSFAKKILYFVLLIELLGTLILFGQFQKDFSYNEALWLSLFHSISAFNNAGFSLFTDSIVSYNANTAVLFTLSALIILGGLGYFVLIELYEHKKNSKRLSLHTKIMLYGTLILLLFGVSLFLSIEWNNDKIFASMGVYDKIINALFLSVNFRTSGFNSIDIGSLKDSSLFFSTVFMMIGGGQGSTAGGIKVTTIAILAITIWYVFKESNQEPSIFQRRIEQKLINKALAILVFSSFFVLFCTLLLVETQNLPFMKILFEVVSAFATVGLSTGNGDILSLSALFNDFGKMIIIILMIAGRVGVFAFAVVLVGRGTIKHFQYPKGRILI